MGYIVGFSVTLWAIFMFVIYKISTKAPKSIFHWKVLPNKKK